MLIANVFKQNKKDLLRSRSIVFNKTIENKNQSNEQLQVIKFRDIIKKLVSGMSRGFGQTERGTVVIMENYIFLEKYTTSTHSNHIRIVKK